MSNNTPATSPTTNPTMRSTNSLPTVIFLTLATFLFMFSSINVRSSDVVLLWNASPSQVLGYKIYYGPRSGGYTNCVTVSNVLTVTIINLEPNTVYYFAATAYDADSESDFSNEVGYTIVDTHVPPNIPMVCIPQGENQPTVIQIQTRIGNYYDVEVSTNLTDWQTIITADSATNTEFIRVMDMTPWNDRKFYRVLVH